MATLQISVAGRDPVRSLLKGTRPEVDVIADTSLSIACVTTVSDTRAEPASNDGLSTDVKGGGGRHCITNGLLDRG